MSENVTMLTIALYFVCPLGIFGFLCPKNQPHCMTSLEIGYGFTMMSEDGPVYAKERKLFNKIGNEVPIENIISADGWNETMPLLTANKSMPGPDIILYQNQKITIVVKNLLINEAVTIHWHGIDQLGWPAMDGVSFVSQCPIMPGQTFNYTFRPFFGGTYWYHSHVGNQRDMGLYGAFIVLREIEPVPLSHHHIIKVQEYYHSYSAITLLRARVSANPDVVLINGRGSYEKIDAPLTVFQVNKRKNAVNTYLFRIISAGSKDTVLFEIPGLRLKVTETDGFQVKPMDVDKIILYPAERYNFEIDLGCAKNGVYNITLQILNGQTLEISGKIKGTALINVTDKSFSEQRDCSQTGPVKILNCPFLIYPSQPDIQCIPISDLLSTETLADESFEVSEVKKTNILNTHFLNFAFVDDHPSINGRHFILPTVSALSQPSELNTDCSSCTDEKGCECSHSINLESGSEVIMVLSNIGKSVFGHHPIHMHGHTYEVLKMKFANVTDDGNFLATEDLKCSQTKRNSDSNCNAPLWSNSSWNNYKHIPGINLDDPVRKDTIVVPLGGYVILRIRASNPGVWFMHCHIDMHMVGGMALMLNESFEYYNNNEDYVPKELPTCHNFDGNLNSVLSNKQNQLPQTDSDSSGTVIGLAVTAALLLSVIILSVGVLCFKHRCRQPSAQIPGAVPMDALS